MGGLGGEFPPVRHPLRLAGIADQDEIGPPLEDLDHGRGPGLSSPRSDLDGAADPALGELAGVSTR